MFKQISTLYIVGMNKALCGTLIICAILVFLDQLKTILQTDSRSRMSKMAGTAQRESVLHLGELGLQQKSITLKSAQCS